MSEARKAMILKIIEKYGHESRLTIGFIKKCEKTACGKWNDKKLESLFKIYMGCK